MSVATFPNELEKQNFKQEVTTAYQWALKDSRILNFENGEEREVQELLDLALHAQAGDVVSPYINFKNGTDTANMNYMFWKNVFPWIFDKQKPLVAKLKEKKR